MHIQKSQAQAFWQFQNSYYSSHHKMIIEKVTSNCATSNCWTVSIIFVIKKIISEFSRSAFNHQPSTIWTLLSVSTADCLTLPSKFIQFKHSLHVVLFSRIWQLISSIINSIYIFWKCLSLSITSTIVKNCER